MDQGEVIGLVISVVATLALAGGFVWLFVFGRRNEWPAGLRIEQVVGGHNATVIWHPGSGGSSLVAASVARAALATANAWSELKGTDEAVKTLGHVAVWLLPDAEFDREAASVNPYRDPKHVAAYLVHVRRRLGQGPPMAVVRASLQDRMQKSGQPCIHEFLHAVGDLYYDGAHRDATVWAKSDAVEQVEERAEAIYVTLLGT